MAVGLEMPLATGTGVKLPTVTVLLVATLLKVPFVKVRKETKMSLFDLSEINERSMCSGYHIGARQVKQSRGDRPRAFGCIDEIQIVISDR